jgi:hypothetical protein
MRLRPLLLDVMNEQGFSMIKCSAILTTILVITTSLNSWPVFVPYKYSVITRFTKKTGGTLIDQDVNPAALAFAVRNKAQIRVAYASPQCDSCAFYLKPNALDTMTGSVRLYTTLKGLFTVVTDAWLNDLPVATNWDASLNNHHGGVRYGASDGIGTVFYDTTKSQLIFKYFHKDTDLGSELFYSKQYALFANDSTGANDTSIHVPSYERYVGEDYSLLSVPNRIVMEVGRRIFSQTGYPAVFRNNTPVKKLYTNSPIFQIINSIPIVLPNGRKGLVTLILPPYWTTNPVKRYPILFGSTYDLHERCLSDAPGFCRVISSVMSGGNGSAIGVFWNSGGAWASYSLQNSLYDMASYIFSSLQYSFGADPNAIIGIGGSRAGFTPLLLAGDPFHSNYRFRLVESNVAHAKPGDNFYSMDPLTYLGMEFSFGYATGYKYAWRSDWHDTSNGKNISAQDLAAFNVAGDTGQQYLNDHGPIGDRCINAMKSKGTKIFFFDGTHDYHKCFSGQLSFIDKVRKAGIPIKTELVLRGGHGCTYDMTDAGQQYNITIGALKNLLAATDPLLDTTTAYYRRVDDDNPQKGFVHFTPSHRPFVLEAPMVAIPGRKWHFCITGEPASRYKIEIYNIYKSKSISGKDTTFTIIQLQTIPEFVISGSLSSSGIDYRSWTEVPNFRTSQPNRYHRAIFYAANSEYDIPEKTFWNNYGWNMFSYGLCEY